MKNSFVSKLFNAFIYGSMPLISEGDIGGALWDGTYIGGYCQVSGPQFTFNAGIRSIYIDVSALSAGTQIKVTCSSQPDRNRFAAHVDLIEDLPLTGYLLLLGSFYQADEDTIEPYEYIYTIPATAKTAIFYISANSDEIVTSVEEV